MQVVPPENWLQFQETTGVDGLLIAGLGITLMLIGAIVLAAITWSRRALELFNRVANWRFLKRVTGGLIGKLEEFRESSQKNRKAIPEIIGITLVCWVLKGLEWYFLGLALGITAIPLIGYFLIHPLVTALGFVPITPAGAGVQEFGIVGIFTLLFVNPSPATIGAIGAFAVLARAILIIQDLIGAPQIAKTTSNLTFTQKT